MFAVTVPPWTMVPDQVVVVPDGPVTEPPPPEKDQLIVVFAGAPVTLQDTEPPLVTEAGEQTNLATLGVPPPPELQYPDITNPVALPVPTPWP